MYGESRSINISVLQIQQILVLIRGDRMPDGGPVCLGHKCRNKFADGCKWPNIHYPLQNTNMMILGIPRIFTLTCLVTSSLSYKKCFANQVEFCTRFAKVATWTCQSYYLYL